MSYQVGDRVTLRRWKDLCNEYADMPNYERDIEYHLQKGAGKEFIIMEIANINGQRIYKISPILAFNENLNTCWFTSFLTTVVLDGNINYQTTYQVYFFQERELENIVNNEVRV